MDRIDFEFYHRALRRGWKLLLLGAVSGALLAFWFAMSRPILYEGVTTLVVASTPGGGSGTSAPGALNSPFENLTLISEVLDELRLNQPPHNLTPQGFLSDRLRVEESDGGRLLKVRVRLEDRELSAEASRRVASKGVALHKQLDARQNASMQEALKEQLDRANERFESAERELLAFQQRAQIDLLEQDAGDLLTDRGEIQDLSIQVAAERARLKVAEEELAKIPRFLADSRTATADSAFRRAPGAAGEGAPAPADTQRQANGGPAPVPGSPLQTAPRPLSPDARLPEAPFLNPVFQSLEYEIAASRSRLAGLERQHRELVEARTLIGENLEELNTLYRRRLDLARLQSNYDVASRIRNELLLSYEKAVVSAMTGPQLHVIDEALPPDRPLSRRVGASAGVGLAAGLLAAGLLVLVRSNSHPA